MLNARSSTVNDFTHVCVCAWVREPVCVCVAVAVVVVLPVVIHVHLNLLFLIRCSGLYVLNSHGFFDCKHNYSWVFRNVKRIFSCFEFELDRILNIFIHELFGEHYKWKHRIFLFISNTSIYIKQMCVCVCVFDESFKTNHRNCTSTIERVDQFNEMSMNVCQNDLLCHCITYCFYLHKNKNSNNDKHCIKLTF